MQVGGPLGAYLPESQFDTPLDYEAFTDIGALLGHGGVVVFDDTVDMAQMARYAMEFCAIESCGKCTPCRIGSTRGVEVIDRVIARPGSGRATSRLLEELCDTMVNGSLCGLGGMTPFPVQSALQAFPGRFRDSDAASADVRAERTLRSIHMYSTDYHDLGTPVADRGKPVTLEIDGVPVTVPEGTSIMRAAAVGRQRVPKLCATDTLKAFGSCRLCLVEIEGRRGLPGVVHDARRRRHQGPDRRARS